MTKEQELALAFAEGFIDKCAQAELNPEAVDESGGSRLGSYLSLLLGPAAFAGGGLLGGKLGGLLGRRAAKAGIGDKQVLKDIASRVGLNTRQGHVGLNPEFVEKYVSPISKSEILGMLGGAGLGGSVAAGETINALTD
jgi:hypothetical protein